MEDAFELHLQFTLTMKLQGLQYYYDMCLLFVHLFSVILQMLFSSVTIWSEFGNSNQTIVKKTLLSFNLYTQ